MASPYFVKFLTPPILPICSSFTSPNEPVQILRLIFDRCINLNEHITSVCWASSYHLKNNHCLKVLLTQEILISVVHAFVLSHIDYCNSRLYGRSYYNMTNCAKTWSHQLIYFKITLATSKIAHPFKYFITNL